MQQSVCEGCWPASHVVVPLLIRTSKKCQNLCIKMGNCRMLKTHASRFMDIKTIVLVLYHHLDFVVLSRNTGNTSAVLHLIMVSGEFYKIYIYIIVAVSYSNIGILNVSG